MEQVQRNWIANFNWGIADAVVEPTSQAVPDMKASGKSWCTGRSVTSTGGEPCSGPTRSDEKACAKTVLFRNSSFRFSRVRDASNDSEDGKAKGSRDR
jgi:hypothetical protein